MKEFFRKIVSWASMGIVCAVLAFFAFPHIRQGESSIAGKTAEDFPIEIDGKPAHLSDLRGKVVVLNFWATWCKPCAEEVPSLMELHKHIAGRGGVVLGVSADEDEDEYRKFLAQYQVNYLTYRDATRKDPEDYGTLMYPETYIIDRKGKIARKIIGYQNWNSPEMQAYFDTILGQS